MIENVEFVISLVRHGESEVNATPDVIGQNPDVQLTKNGIRQAELLHERFLRRNDHFDLIYSSPYDRALHTAKIAIPDKDQDIILAPELREYDAGSWTGASRADVLTQKVKLQMNLINQMFKPPNGESCAMVERRASQWLEEHILYNKNIAIESSRRAINNIAPLNILCFSHGVTIKSLLHYIVGFDKSFIWKINISNTSITKLYFSKEGWGLININDYSHLEGM